MIEYELIIYWGKADDAFVVEIPEFPGCMTDGKIYRKAVSNAEAIIQKWIDTAKEMGRMIMANTRICQECKAEIPRGARKCMYCDAQLEGFKRGAPPGWMLAILLLCLIVGYFVWVFESAYFPG